MQNVTVGSLVGLSALLVTLGACHNRPGARHGHAADRDRDHDERVVDRDRDHDEHNDERHDPEVGSGLSTNSAVRAIAKARCERESRCNNVGPDKDYASVGACEEKVRADWAGDLNKYECPGGTNKAELDECIAGVRSEDCGNPFDTLARIAQCDSSDICEGD